MESTFNRVIRHFRVGFVAVFAIAAMAIAACGATPNTGVNANENLNTNLSPESGH